MPNRTCCVRHWCCYCPRPSFLLFLSLANGVSCWQSYLDAYKSDVLLNRGFYVCWKWKLIKLMWCVQMYIKWNLPFWNKICRQCNKSCDQIDAWTKQKICSVLWRNSSNLHSFWLVTKMLCLVDNVSNVNI